MRDSLGKLTLSPEQIEGIAACIVALREVPRLERMDCLVVLCRSLWEERTAGVLFPEDKMQKGPGTSP